jgi:hypothetical protein
VNACVLNFCDEEYICGNLISLGLDWSPDCECLCVKLCYDYIMIVFICLCYDYECLCVKFCYDYMLMI